MTREVSLEEFYQKYLQEFKSSSDLINQSLTHRSFSFENNLQQDNERLEFLGDSLIGSVVSAYLYQKYPESNEGELSKMKAALVSRSMLGRRALEMGMGELLLLGHGEEKSGGRHRLSLLGSALEALVGALYLELGLAKSFDFVQNHVINHISHRINSEAFTDYKSRFQEIVQKRYQQVPDYRTVDEAGPDHNKRFCVEVYVKGDLCGTGWGQRKKIAESEAARQALAKFEQEGNKSGPRLEA